MSRSRDFSQEMLKFGSDRADEGCGDLRPVARTRAQRPAPPQSVERSGTARPASALKAHQPPGSLRRKADPTKGCSPSPSRALDTRQQWSGIFEARQTRASGRRSQWRHRVRPRPRFRNLRHRAGSIGTFRRRASQAHSARRRTSASPSPGSARSGTSGVGCPT